MKKTVKIRKVIRKTYSEVKLAETEFGRDYKNPLTARFQYEYALYRAVSDLFSSVRCNSMCIESLKLYFRELPPISKNEETPEYSSSGKKRKSQESLLAEASMLVTRDVVSKITFPQINICQSEVNVLTQSDGTHTFLFSDGVYGFTVSLDMKGNGHPKGILIEDLSA